MSREGSGHPGIAALHPSHLHSTHTQGSTPTHGQGGGFHPQQTQLGIYMLPHKHYGWVITSAVAPFAPHSGQDSRDAVETRNKGLRAKGL